MTLCWKLGFDLAHPPEQANDLFVLLYTLVIPHLRIRFSKEGPPDGFFQTKDLRWESLLESKGFIR